MNTILRHRQYPLVLIYKGPKESWDSYAADIVKRDVEENNYDRFTVITVEQMAEYLQDVFTNHTKENQNESK